MKTSKTSRQKSIICQSSEDAFDKICQAFADFGEMLNIEFRMPNRGISEEANDAAVQASYSDPDFLRGTLLLHRFFHHDEAETSKIHTMALASELFAAASKVDAERARSNLRSIEIVLQWLCEKAQ